MALQRLVNGQYVVKTLKEAKEALLAVQEMNDNITQLQEEHGILEMMQDSTEMKKAATVWAASKDMERIELGQGRYVLLRRDKYGGTWVATDDDVDESVPTSVVPLRAILKKKFKDAATFKEVWMRVTKRTVDVDALQREVADKYLTADEIAPAFFEKEKAPFLRFYGF
jgi:hypothetical protein